MPRAIDQIAELGRPVGDLEVLQRRAQVTFAEAELPARGRFGGDEHALRVEHDLGVGTHLERGVAQAGLVR